MKCYQLLMLLLIGVMSCDKRPPLDPTMTSEFIMGEINGVPFKSVIVTEYGAEFTKDWCDKGALAIQLVQKHSEREYQIILINSFHIAPGTYVLTDSSVSHNRTGVCLTDSINFSLYFRPYPRGDQMFDRYRLVEGPWNTFEIISYDPKKREIEVDFSAKFVRTNPTQLAPHAVDTIAYTNAKFIVSNINVYEMFTEPH